MVEQATDNDEAGLPVIKKVSARIAALERRAEFLEDQIEDGATGPILNFAKGELKALNAGITALRYHRAEVEGLDQPILALEELMQAAEATLGGIPGSVERDRTLAAIRRSVELLAEWEAKHG